MPTADLVAALRADKLHVWKPPGGGHEGALVHVVIHGLDVTVPAGIDRPIPEERIRVVLDAVTQPKTVKFFGVDLTGIELRADDIDWSFGSGTPLSGKAADLALVVCGRTLPADRVHRRVERPIHAGLIRRMSSAGEAERCANPMMRCGW